MATLLKVQRAAAYFTSPKGKPNHRIIHVHEGPGDAWTIELIGGHPPRTRSEQTTFTRREALMYYLIEIGKLVMAGYQPETVDKFPQEI